MSSNSIGNIIEFRESINREFNLIKNRVRNLIADSHWLSDGQYKEIILRNIIRRFLPPNFSIGTGFIVESENDDTNKPKCSTQIDILIYDNSNPKLFSEGDFVIIEPQTVKAIIEVKTTLNSKIEFEKAANKLNTIQKSFFPHQSIDKIMKKRQLFMGLFSYDCTDVILEENTYDIYNTPPFFDTALNFICLGESYFFRRLKSNHSCFKMYEIENMAYSYFISNLLQFLLPPPQELSKLWFPIDKTMNQKFEVQTKQSLF